MKKSLTLLVFCIVALGALEALAQGTTNTIVFKEVPLNKALDSVAQHTGAKIYYAQDWVKDLVVNGSYSGNTPKILLEALLSGTNLNVFEWETQYIITQNTLIYPDIVASFYRGEFQKANSSDAEIKELSSKLPKKSSSKLPLEISFNNKTKPTKNPLKKSPITIGKQTNYIAVNGYTITGKITEADGITPIPNATIILNNQEDYTSTDGSGAFAFEGISYGTQLLKVSIVGYQNIEQPIKVFNNGTVNLSLQESFEALEEVVVKAGAKKAVQEVGSGGSSFTPEETKNIPLILGERDLFKVATTLPGVSSAGEGAAGFNVRGGKTDQNLILLDRAVVYNPTHFFGLFPALNPFAVAALNVYKGSIPVKYGGRLSAVFDMETKAPNNQSVKGEASLGPITANLMLEIPLQKDSASILIGGRSAHANWVLGALKQESVANSTALFYDGIIKYQHQLNKKNTLKTTLYHSKDAFSINSDSIYGYTNTAISIQWQRQLANKQFLNTAITHSRYGFTIDYEGTGNNGFKQGYDLSDTQLLLDSKIQLHPKHSITYGVMAKNYRMELGFNKPYGINDLTSLVDLEAEQALEMAVFAADLINLSDKTAVELGLRYNIYAQLGAITQRIYEPNSPFNNGSLNAEEVIDKGQIAATYTGLAPRISFRYLLNENNSIKASYNKAFQFIHTLSNATTPAPNDSWKLSDNNIKPQASQQFSLGIYHNSASQKYTASAEGFYKKQENLLDFKTGASLVLNPRVEQEVIQGLGKSYGVELFLQKNIGKLNGWLSYTFSRSLLQLASDFRNLEINNGAYFPSNFDKPHDFSGVLNYQFSKRWSFSANLIYQTGRPVTFPIGNYQFNGSEFVLYSDRNSYRIPDYYRLDLGINLEGNHRKNKAFNGFWSLSVYNALGRNNPYSVFFVNEGGEIKALQSSIFAVAVPSLTYTVNF